MAADNKSLGRFILDGIPPAPRGVPQVEVSFDIDANGILSVKAKDKATNKEQRITITASSGLSKDEVERMRKDAEAHAEDDRKKREEAEARNQAETIIFQTEKLIKESGDKMKPEDKSELGGKLDALKKAKESGDAEAVKKTSDDLMQSAQKVGAAMYQSEAQASGPSSEAGTSEDGGAKTVEGEFEEKQ
jgi:molecular chaperone DnaK